MVDGEEGYLPLYFAANWGASLDVIFCLLQRCPDSLFHVGGRENTAAAAVAALGSCLSIPTVATSRSTKNGIVQTCDDHHEQQDARGAPVKKKAKTISSALFIRKGKVRKALTLLRQKRLDGRKKYIWKVVIFFTKTLTIYIYYKRESSTIQPYLSVHKKISFNSQRSVVGQSSNFNFKLTTDKQKRDR
jgi:hypothetical protein